MSIVSGQSLDADDLMHTTTADSDERQAAGAISASSTASVQADEALQARLASPSAFALDSPQSVYGEAEQRANSNDRNNNANKSDRGRGHDDGPPLHKRVRGDTVTEVVAHAVPALGQGRAVVGVEEDIGAAKFVENAVRTLDPATIVREYVGPVKDFFLGVVTDSFCEGCRR